MVQKRKLMGRGLRLGQRRGVPGYLPGYLNKYTNEINTNLYTKAEQVWCYTKIMLFTKETNKLTTNSTRRGTIGDKSA